MLRTALLMNAASCLLFGAIFCVWPQASANFIGNPPVLLLNILGIGLVLNGLALIWTARLSNPARVLVILFSLGDAVWVFATLVLLAVGLWISGTVAIAMSVCVAAFVGLCGALQLRHLPSK